MIRIPCAALRPALTRAYSSVSLANRDCACFDLSRLPSGLIASLGISLDDFQLYPSFYKPEEQSLLLSSALALMNRKASVEERSHMKAWRSRNRGHKVEPGSFLPVGFFSSWIGDYVLNEDVQDEAYSFEQSHFDTVITGFRERTVTSWPTSSEAETALLPSILKRLYDLLPNSPTAFAIPPPYSNTPDQMAQPDFIPVPNHLLLHLLHLSGQTGQIFPHVDNVNASGQTIIGVSLGTARVMRFELADPNPDQKNVGFDVLVEPGSVYVQNASIRYKFKHSLPLKADWGGKQVGGGQRLSIMLRDKLANATGSAGMSAAA